MVPNNLAGAPQLKSPQARIQHTGAANAHRRLSRER
eukprot:COSAG06_NODE_161_length_21630_cov_19.444661_10_plen_36_part_00